ncbi:hypothetical protein [Alkalihalobacillus sp. TS-13]|uniref:hypothetical protein n=1 Tax=Alkalihalobacillus sp. TS-13 TaxID=2842455 RepID=UPI001C88493D|nr:hypothetical protein [Alkalihalobacillus sp. TS-13]
MIASSVLLIHLTHQSAEHLIFDQVTKIAAADVSEQMTHMRRKIEDRSKSHLKKTSTSSGSSYPKNLYQIEILFHPEFNLVF